MDGTHLVDFVYMKAPGRPAIQVSTEQSELIAHLTKGFVQISEEEAEKEKEQGGN